MDALVPKVGAYRTMAERRRLLWRKVVRPPRDAGELPADFELEYHQVDSEIQTYLRDLLQALPFGVEVAHAYAPRESATHGGSDHVVLLRDLDLGRLRREKGDALCKPAKKFWGLVVASDRLPDCLACIERVEKISLELSRRVLTT